jgi:hypothetical protein
MTQMRLLVSLILIALAVPLAAAQPMADVTATMVTAHGETSVDAALAVFSLSERMKALGITGLSIDADTIYATVDHRDDNRTVVGAGTAPDEVWQESFSLNDAHLEMKSRDTHPDVFVAPRGHARVHLTSSPLAGSTGAHTIEQDDHLRHPAHRGMTVGTSGSTTWSGTDAQLRIEGDFLVVLWGLTFEVGDSTVRTGAWLEDTDVPLVQKSHAAQAWLEIRGGSLTLGLEELQARQLHVRGATLSSDTKLVFTETQGSVNLGSQRLALEGTVEMAGVLSASAEPESTSRLRSAVSGRPDEIFVDAQAVAMPVAPGMPASPAWTWMLLPLLGALPLIGVGWRRRRNESLFFRMRSAMQSADYGAVVAVPPRRLRSGRHAPEAAVMRTTAYIRLGQDAKARRALDEWPPAAYPWDRDFLRAHLHARRGDWALAAAALRAALAQSPSLAEAAAADPLLRRLADTPMREGYT